MTSSTTTTVRSGRSQRRSSNSKSLLTTSSLRSMVVMAGSGSSSSSCRCSGGLWLIPLLLLVLLGTSTIIPSTDAFIVPQHSATTTTTTTTSSTTSPVPHQRDSSSTRTPRRHSATNTQLFVFERMSEDCISAIVTAQEQTNKLQVENVQPPALLAGIVDHPETKAMQRTLSQYKITWRRITTILAKLYLDDDDENNKGWLSGFRAASEDDDRPFSQTSKQAFVQAGKLADQMGSTTVSTHHIFLALLDYREESSSTDNKADNNVTATTDNETWQTLQKLQILDDNVTALQICQTLLKNLQETTDASSTAGAGSSSAELVTGRGGSDSNKKMPTLDEIGIDLTQQAQDGLLDPVFGRTKEIRACIRTLIRRRKNNVCLVGDAGVGKTCIAEGVAQVLVSDDQCPAPLQGHRLVAIEMASLVAGTKYRGEFEERLQSIIEEVTNPKSPPTILFLDEMHNLVGAGAAEGGMDAANLLKPSLARGQLQVMGATTISEYRKYIEKDAALERRFQKVMVKEPTIAETVEILQAVQPNYEQHHRVQYTPPALLAAAELSERYLSDRKLPDKAIDLLDEAGANAQLEFLEQQEEDADDFAEDDDTEREVPVVTEHTVAEVISEWSGIPLGKLETTEMETLQRLEADMTKRVKGQSRAVRSVARAIRRARSGLRDPKRPVGVFLFSGPTGTGKTELCKTLAETYYGSEKDMIRIDMSEYMEKHSVSRLTGPPPGYIGYEEGGQLTEAVRSSPHSVVLLDEVEKAHEDVLNILLQIMEDGILTDGKGRTVNFKNSVLVMTSNVGSRRILGVCRGDANEAGAEQNGQKATGDVSVTETIQAINGGSVSSAPPIKVPQQLDIGPLKPEDILEKMQKNPQAASIMMKASTDPEIMGAIRTAMNGSPADLRAAAQKNPTISEFLQELWSALNEDTNDSVPAAAAAAAATATATTTAESASSGLDTIRSSFQETIAQWDDSTTDNFASGLLEQLDDTTTTNTQTDHALYPELIRVVKEELEAAMKPELLNRIDEIVVFSPLSTDDLSMIARLNIDKIISRASEEHSMELTVDQDLVDRVTHEGSAYADQFGARPIRRAAQRYVEDSLSDAIIQGFVKPGGSARLSLAPPHLDGKDRVVVTAKDGQSIIVEIEDASGGIGSSPQIASSATTEATTSSAEQQQLSYANGDNSQLRTEPVQ